MLGKFHAFGFAEPHGGIDHYYVVYKNDYEMEEKQRIGFEVASQQLLQAREIVVGIIGNLEHFLLRLFILDLSFG